MLSEPVSPDDLDGVDGPVLTIDIDFALGACRLGLQGQLRARTVELLRDVVDSVLARRQRVVIDLRDVSVCDGSGVEELVSARRRAQEAGCPLRLTGVRSFVQEVERSGAGAELLDGPVPARRPVRPHLGERPAGPRPTVGAGGSRPAAHRSTRRSTPGEDLP